LVSTENVIMWEDWKDRQTELVDKAEFFEFSQRPTAAQWIRQLSESVATTTSRNMLKKYLNELFAAWVADFAGNDEIRKRKANAVSSIILSSIAYGKLTDEILTVLPILQELGKNLDNLGTFGESICTVPSEWGLRNEFLRNELSLCIVR
jgi:hypothetical protein